MMEATTYQTAAPEIPNHSKTEQESKPYITTEREYQTIVALLGGNKSTVEITEIVGDASPRDLIYKLRKKNWQLKTVPKSMKDRYGKKVNANEYQLETDYETSKASLQAYKGAKR